MFYNCVGAEILRIGRVSSNLENFKTDGKELLDRAVKQGAKKGRLKRLLKRVYGRHQALRKFHSNAKKFFRLFYSQLKKKKNHKWCTCTRVRDIHPRRPDSSSSQEERGILRKVTHI